MLVVGFIYFSILAFVGLSLYKFYKYASMPMHSRWELYPVPKEPGEKGHYGGSYYEDKEWWKKSRSISHFSEIKEMLKEMLFIKILLVNNKKHWFISYPMHFAIYLLGLWAILLVAGAGVELSGASLASTESAVLNLLYYSIIVVGTLGWILLALGSTGLLLRRILNSDYSKYTTPLEYFNLLFILAVAISGIVVWMGDMTFGYALEVMKGVLTVSSVQAGTALTVHVILAGAFLAYTPQTKMSHYVGKYFAFHKVLWENEPNLRDSKIEQLIKKAVNNKPEVTWSAPHINPGSSESKTK